MHEKYLSAKQPVAKGRTMQHITTNYASIRCKRCIFPDSIPGIFFDKRGVCNFCQNYTPIRYLGENKLRSYIEDAKGKHRQYDCIIPLSGGRDSTYALWLAVTQYNLKVLAVNYDSGLQSETAKSNMAKVCKSLDVEFVSFKSNKNLFKKAVVSSVKDSLKYGVKSLAARRFCRSCWYNVTAAAYKAAKLYNVPLIITGGSPHDLKYLGIFKKALFNGHLLNPYFQHSSSMRDLKNLGYYNLKFGYYHMLQILEIPPTSDLIISKMYNEYLKRITNTRINQFKVNWLQMFDYIPWNREEIKDTIVSEVGWKKPANARSTWRMDCKLSPLLQYAYKNAFGCSKSGFGYHSMINENQMKRVEALAQEEKVPFMFTKDLKIFLKEIGLVEEDIEIIKSFQKNDATV